MHPHPLPHGALDAIPAQPRADARTRVSAGRYRAARAHPSRPVGHRHAGRPAPAPVVLLGTPHVVAGGVLVTAAVVALDLTLTHRLSLFFDLCFILVCLCAALLVRRRGLYTVGILPPLLLGAVVAAVAVLSPAALTDSRLPLVSTWLTGLAHHGVALAAAHVVVLAIVGLRATTQPAGTDRSRPARESR